MENLFLTEKETIDFLKEVLYKQTILKVNAEQFKILVNLGLVENQIPVTFGSNLIIYPKLPKE